MSYEEIEKTIKKNFQSKKFKKNSENQSEIPAC